jgi:hypothetical protein
LSDRHHHQHDDDHVVVDDDDDDGVNDVIGDGDGGGPAALNPFARRALKN